MDDNSSVIVSIDVTNTGAMTGKEVVQLYVSDLNGTAGRPQKELKGFAKVDLAPGETKTVTLPITARDLSYWEESLGDWYAPSGKYGILVGRASDAILLRGEVEFSTRKLLPLQVTMATTLGDLKNDPRTAPVFGELMGQMGGGGSSRIDMNDPSMRAMAEAMLQGMPIKSLVSFGMMTPEQASGLIAAFNSALKA